MSFSLARPSLSGRSVRRPVRAFLAGLMLLAGLILLAACANLGSLFAARAADRSREWLCGSRWARAANAFCVDCLAKPC